MISPLIFFTVVFIIHRDEIFNAQRLKYTIKKDFYHSDHYTNLKMTSKKIPPPKNIRLSAEINRSKILYNHCSNIF